MKFSLVFCKTNYSNAFFCFAFPKTTISMYKSCSYCLYSSHTDLGSLLTSLNSTKSKKFVNSLIYFCIDIGILSGFSCVFQRTTMQYRRTTKLDVRYSQIQIRYQEKTTKKYGNQIKINSKCFSTICDTSRDGAMQGKTSSRETTSNVNFTGMFNNIGYKNR